MNNKGSEIYPRHRLETLEPYYSRHVGAMTELPGRQEGLHSKSDIAEQLAWRDQAIASLRAALAEATKLREHNAEAARILCHVPDTVLLGLNGGAEWPAFCAWATERERLRAEAKNG